MVAESQAPVSLVRSHAGPWACGGAGRYAGREGKVSGVPGLAGGGRTGAKAAGVRKNVQRMGDWAGAFTKALVRENRQWVGRGRKIAAALQEIREAVWQEHLIALLRGVSRRTEELASAGKSVDWKLAVASVMKARTTVTNRWLADALHLGNLHEVSRKVAAWTRQPDPELLAKLTAIPIA